MLIFWWPFFQGHLSWFLPGLPTGPKERDSWQAGALAMGAVTLSLCLTVHVTLANLPKIHGASVFSYA